jgi:protein O-mannosyl-transferase
VDASPARVPVRSWLYPSLLTAGGLLAFANSLRSAFVFDDQTAILTNPFVRDLWSLDALRGPIQSAVAGRPVVSLSLAVNYALGGYEPWSYHAWNLGVHILAALLLYGIVRRTLANDHVAFAAALIWLVHPLQTEVINYVTQRTESMMGFFYLLTLYAAIRGWPVVAVSACALGMACKESMVTAPVVVLLYDAVFMSGSVKRALARRPWMYAGLAASWAVLAALIAQGPRWRSAGFSSGLSPWTYLLNQPQYILTYLKLAVWPSPLVLDYGHARATSLAAVWPAGIGVVLLLLGTALAWLRWPAIAFLATSFWLMLAPTSSFVPIATEVAAERRMYLPLATWVVLVVAGVNRWLTHGASARSLAGVKTCATAVVAGLFIWLTVQRNSEYRSEEAVWRTVLERRPTGRAHYSLGVRLFETGRASEAVSHFRLALEDEPRAHYALGLTLEREGKLADAAREYQTYLQQAPDDTQAPQGWIRLGIVLLQQERHGEAIAALKTALQMRPSDRDAQAALFEAYGSLGMAFVEQNREAEAIEPLEQAAALQPNDGAARLRLGNALAAVGRLDEAIAQYRAGIAVVPTSPVLHRMLGFALARSGRFQDAATSLEQALKLDPNDVETRSALEQLRRLTKS